jgi:NNP family nitrate/nitrite transporter-like MFS transporter
MNTRGSARALTLSTVAFAIAFAVWGMISPMAKTFQKEMHLTEQQTWLIIALPVLLGAIGRIPVGMLADRYGGRLVFGVLLTMVSIPAFMLSKAHTYNDLLFWGLLLGTAGTSFSVGVSFTSRWFPPEKQGFALGIYGAGNIGQSIALFGIPLLAGILGGWQATFQVFALAALLYGIFFLTVATDAPARSAPKSFGAMLSVLAKNPMAWLLSMFYFVTFGGFVALSIGLPKLLQELFHLTKEDAGLRVAGFVLVATAMRPLGGYISDRIGGAKLLLFVFTGAGILALGMTYVSIVPFTIGALGVAACIGLGNGGVFKLVPQFFPQDTGTVTGLVGGMGGLGGFFPPLVLGIIKTQTGSYALGFVFLSAFCFVCLVLNQVILIRRPGKSPGLRVFLPRQPDRRADEFKRPRDPESADARMRFASQMP